MKAARGKANPQHSQRPAAQETWNDPPESAASQRVLLAGGGSGIALAQTRFRRISFFVETIMDRRLSSAILIGN